MSDPVSINLDDDTDRWRWACPNGHRSWEATNEHFWCAQCAQAAAHDADVEPEFDELRNLTTGETVRRDEIELLTAAGSYHAVYGGEGAP